MMENTFGDIIFEAAIRETPISSGNGEAIMKPAAKSKRYFLRTPGNLPSKYFTIFSFDNLLISSEKEYLIKLKINKSPIKAPKPPIILAR